MDASPSYLRPAAVLAGSLGVIQSLVWMALAITSIVAYYCNLDFGGVTATMGSITGLTLFQLYFRGTCQPENFPAIDFGIFDSLNLMRSLDIHAWSWVYLMMSFFWFISSCTLLSHVKSKYIRWVNIFLYFWIAITLAVAIIDLVLGILFGLDFEKVVNAGHAIALVPVAGAAAPTNPQLLIAGQAAIGTLFSVVLRGYVLWLVNVVLVVFLFLQTLLVSDYNRLTPFRRTANGGQANGGYQDETPPRKPHPIEAFGSQDTPNLWFSPPAETQSATAPVADDRAPFHHSRSVFEERKQFYNNLSRSSVPRVQASSISSHNNGGNHQQPQQQLNPAVLHLQPNDDSDIQYRQKKVVHELNQRHSQMPAQLTAGSGLNGGRYPDPDYSPPMPRVNPFEQRRATAKTGF